MLPDVAGNDVVELGCGTAYFSAWLARRGARPVGVDVTPGAARDGADAAAGDRARVPADRGECGESVPLPDALVRPRALRVRRVDLGRPVPLDPGGGAAAAAGRRARSSCATRRSSILCARARRPAGETLQRPQRGLNRIDWADDGTSSSTSPHGELIALLRAPASRSLDLVELYAPDDAGDARVLRLRHRRVGEEAGPPRRSGWRGSGELARRRRRSCSRRRARSAASILEQLGIPFDVVAPDYEEHDPPDADRYELVREHARGKARSVARLGGRTGRCSASTPPSSLDGAIFGKPANAAEAERMLEQLAGKTHTVVSGLCLLTPGWEVVEHESTQRHLPRADAARARAPPGARRVGGTRGRLRDPGPRRRARRADRGRLPERRRPAGGAARAAPRRALPRRLRLRVAAADERVPAAVAEEAPQRDEEARRRRHAVARARPLRASPPARSPSRPSSGPPPSRRANAPS